MLNQLLPASEEGEKKLLNDMVIDVYLIAFKLFSSMQY